MFKINVKWGKQKFKDVELNTNEGAETFMNQLYSLSNVPVEKQKISIKGTKLKTDTDLTKLKLKEGMTIMMIGTAEGKFLKEPKEKTVFLEDLTPEEKAKLFKEKTGKALPAGLVNLGNTWYMNSLVQCLSKSKELVKGIQEHQPDAGDANAHNQLVVAAKSMYADLDSKGESFPPYSFVQNLRSLHPQFDETDNQGRHMQQDSQECFNAIMRSFEAANMRFDFGGEDKNLTQHLFDLDLEVTLSNTQWEEEEKKVSHEKAKMLSCTIENGNKPISHLFDGIKVNLEGEVEAHSDVTDSTNIYKKDVKMNNLPPYLVCNLVRFFWKKESVTAGTQAGKSKILKNVSFPMVLDTYDLCSESLRESLKHGREYETRLREEHDEKMLSGKGEDAPMEDAEKKEDKKEENEDAKMEEEKTPAASTKKAPKKVQPSINDNITYRDHGTGLDTGKYQLVGVVTHQGRTADGGHYIGWIHDTEDEWLQCDDDFVSRVKSQDILNLKGGGDWHMAYLLVYRKIEIVEGDEV